ncbi:protein maternal effect lethal 26-like [Paramacrobiotus metropolitanus]|uniref:protein maternal effect lethal 26-like n=1 Tax=Paramacrobiotus metropolitanus TaxID=2943436 RepID=UPI002445D8B5|nr:protein maternal effect lethal 26-like [Paramacrobiotus metropolitanus]
MDLSSPSDVPLRARIREERASSCQPVRFALELTLEKFSASIETKDRSTRILSSGITMAELGLTDLQGRWRLDVRPCWFSPEDPENVYFGCYVNFVGQDAGCSQCKSFATDTVHATYQLSISTGKIAPQVLKASGWHKTLEFSDRNPTWGKSKLCSHELLFGSPNGRRGKLKDDTITVKADVVFNYWQRNIEKVYLSNNGGIDSVRANVSDHQKFENAMKRQLEHFRNSSAQKGTHDFCLESSDGQQFYTDMCILMAHSVVFEAMLSHDCVEKTSKYCRLTDIDGETVKILLEYMYGCETGKISPANAEKVLAAADKYDMKELRSFCEGVLTANISSTNAAHCLALSCQRGLDGLQRAVLKFINVGNMVAVFSNDAIMEITKYDPEMLQNILQSSIGNANQ